MFRENDPAFESIQAALGHFDTTNLKTLSGRQFRKRYERKYILHQSQLSLLLERARGNYAVLEVNHTRMQFYTSQYFDTGNADMFHHHHDARFPRFKVRYRTYHVNGLTFLEVKRKDDQGRSFKKRIRSGKERSSIDVAKEMDFISKNTPYHPATLLPCLKNDFYRITLAGTETGERITLDAGISFYSEGNVRKDLDGIAVIEVKTGSDDPGTSFEALIPGNPGSESSFSKYCTGRILLDPGLTSENFRPVLRRIHDIQGR